MIMTYRLVFHDVRFGGLVIGNLPNFFRFVQFHRSVLLPANVRDKNMKGHVTSGSTRSCFDRQSLCGIISSQLQPKIVGIAQVFLKMF